MKNWLSRPGNALSLLAATLLTLDHNWTALTWGGLSLLAGASLADRLSRKGTEMKYTKLALLAALLLSGCSNAPTERDTAASLESGVDEARIAYEKVREDVRQADYEFMAARRRGQYSEGKRARLREMNKRLEEASRRVGEADSKQAEFWKDSGEVKGGQP